jgi:hypothetical protein
LYQAIVVDIDFEHLAQEKGLQSSPHSLLVSH